MNKAEIAEIIGVSRAYITMIGNGKRKLTKELQSKLEMMLVNNQIHPSDLKSASLDGSVGSSPSLGIIPSSITAAIPA